jgi:BRCT domain type II-containing protein
MSIQLVETRTGPSVSELPSETMNAISVVTMTKQFLTSPRPQDPAGSQTSSVHATMSPHTARSSQTLVPKVADAIQVQAVNSISIWCSHSFCAAAPNGDEEVAPKSVGVVQDGCLHYVKVVHHSVEYAEVR